MDVCLRYEIHFGHPTFGTTSVYHMMLDSLKNICDLKNDLSERFHTPAHKQKWVVRAVVLEDESTLSGSGVEENDIIEISVLTGQEQQTIKLKEPGQEEDKPLQFTVEEERLILFFKELQLVPLREAYAKALHALLVELGIPCMDACKCYKIHFTHPAHRSISIYQMKLDSLRNIRDLKTDLSKRLHTPANQQKWVVQSVLLEDGSTLSGSGVEENDIIEISLQPE